MKRLIFTTLLIIQACISGFAYNTYTPYVSGATKMGTYNGYDLYLWESGNVTFSYNPLTIFGSSLAYLYVDCVKYKNPGTTFGMGVSSASYTFDPSIILPDFNYHQIVLNWSQTCSAMLGVEPFYIKKTSPSIQTVCSQQSLTLYIATSSTQRWEKSSNGGSTWSNITCITGIYTESNPTAGTYIYRALNGDGTYSALKQVTYVDAVPSNHNVSPATNTKTVDEGVTLTSSITDAGYIFQWYKNGTAISNANTSSYSIPVIKSADAGSYTCLVSNGCNSVTSVAATITVNKAPQTITFPDIPTKTYGDGLFTLPATTDKGLTIIYQSTNTAVATISGNTVTIVAPGTANIIASQTGNSDYEAATGVTKSLTVNKISQSISLSSTATKTFGDAAFTLPSTTDKSKTIIYTSSNTTVATVSGNTVTIKGAGTTDITATQTGDTYNYAAPTVTQTLTVNKANQAITFSAFATKTYGDAAITLPSTTDKSLTIAYSSNNTAVASVIGNTLTINKAGIATITASQSGNSNYAVASTVSRDITIQKANQSIVWSNIPNKTFGDAPFTLPLTTDKGLALNYQSADSTIAKISGNTVTLMGAGTVNITATQSGSDNYNAASSVTLPLSVSKVTQTITFANLPAYTFGASPVKISASSNSGIALTYESSDPNVASILRDTITINNAGQCYITASVVGNTNYLTGTPVQKLLTVNKASQSVTLDAIADKTYGDAAFSLSASANTSLPVTFSSSSPTKLIISGANATIAGAGSYTVTATQSGNSNYNSATATRTLTVNKGSLSVTADNKTRIYGDANPTFTMTYSGFVNGDSKAELAALPSATSTATATSTVGSFDITLSTITDANYTLTYRKGLLTVNKAPLSVTAQNTTKVYGDANPTLNVNFLGFKNSETANVLTTQPVATTVSKTMSNVGVYDIICSGGDATNYDITYTNGQLSITKATLKVNATDVTRTYGDSNPSFTMNVAGYKGSDDISVLSSTPTASCLAIATSPCGSYNITYSGGSADNYLFDYSTTVGKLTVSKANLAVTAENKIKVYGDVNPQLTLAYSGFKNSENSGSLTAQPTVTTTATTSSNVGTYTINPSGGTSTNYTFNYNAGQLTVSKAPLTITANNATKVYGDTNPTFNVSYSGFKNSQTSTALSVLPSLSCSAQTMSNVGDYDIIPIEATASNYNISFINGNLAVSKTPLTISVKNDTVNVGDSLPTFRIMYVGFKGADIENNLEIKPTVTCNATNTSTIGTYDLTLNGGLDKNYSFNYTNGVLVVKEPNGLKGLNSFNVTIFPVPTKNMLYIKSDMPISKSEIYTLDGRLVLYHSVNCKDAMDLSGLTNGIYMLKLHSDVGITTRLVIKE